MRVFYFTEQPYPNAWDRQAPSLRITLPSSKCDPVVMADLYGRYLDEWLLADELGFDIMVNEHHSTATCAVPIAAVTLAILARQTKRARLLTLGYPIANRLDPVRIAEELAMIDVISRGRLEIGFVRGVPYEVPVATRSAVGMGDRFWEAHDLILKALATRTGPFNWNGRHFQQRNINIWPPVFQSPLPPVWISGRSPGNIREIAAKGHVFATFLSGAGTRDMFDMYRQVYSESGLGTAGEDRLAYLGLVAVANTQERAIERGKKLMRYLETSAQVSPQFRNPPGYMTPEITAKTFRSRVMGITSGASGKIVDAHTGSIEELIDANIVFVGTPDQVTSQISEFYERVGGFGNLLMMGHAADMSHEDTVDNLTLFGREVLPHLKALKSPAPQGQATPSHLASRRMGVASA
jgi:alkanesulfonate monooxygenase SsuD/methylene tetrahydromethanopterin reductase-like flavin-dependent oxidoreductase (luciferase family)